MGKIEHRAKKWKPVFRINDAIPLTRITNSLERVSQGDLRTTVPYTHNGNEIGMMARALMVFRDTLAEARRLRDLRQG